MSIEKITKRYVYITDREHFHDKFNGRNLDEDAMAYRIRKVLGTSALQSEVDDLIDSLKMAGLTKAEFKPKAPPRNSKAALTRAIQDSYDRLKPHISLVRSCDPLAVVLYSITAGGEVAYAGPCTEEQFRAIVSANKGLAEKLKTEFEISAALQDKFGFTDFIREIFRQFEFDPDKALETDPALLSWSPDEPAFRVLNPGLLEPGPTPAWDQFTSRIDYPETFKAYIWSIFEPSNFGRQALWIQGEGNDGKSTAIRAITNFMGTKHTLTIGIGSYDSDFFFGTAFGKRLAIYPDCKNLQVLRKERIKSLLGRDIVSINNKYEKAFSAQVYGKLIVASNWLPQINYADSSERTRLLLVRVSAFSDEFGDPDFEAALTAEMGAFLHKCRKSYADQCPRGMSLNVPLKMRESIKIYCNALDSVLLEQFVAERLVFGPDYSVRRSDLYSKMKEYFSAHYASQDSAFSFNDLSRILSQKGIKPSQELGESSVYVGVRLKYDES